MSDRFAIQLTTAAARQLRKLDRTAQQRVRAAIDLLADNPRPAGAKHLVGGEGELLVRTGDYRIIYEIDDGRLIVLVIALGHRREIYR